MGLFERASSLPAEEVHRIEFRGTFEWLSPGVSANESAEMQPEPEPDLAEQTERDGKKAVTFAIRTSLKKRAETAVLRTAGYEGGYLSMAALLEGAIERELERLADEFNDGEPFLVNVGSFRRGRPAGS